MGDKLNNLIQRYKALGQSYGFRTDDDFMRAWYSDPQKFSEMFAMRMAIINALAA